MSTFQSKHSPGATPRRSATTRPSTTATERACAEGTSSERIQPGCYLIGVADEALAPHVRAAFEMEALTRSNSMGIPMPGVDDVLAVYYGGDRVRETLLSDIGLEGANVVARRTLHCSANADEYDHLSNEGLPSLLRTLNRDSGCSVVISCTLTLPASVHTIAALYQLDAKAKAKNHYVFIIGTLVGDGNLSALRAACSGCFEANQCEPDQDSQLAFSLEPSQWKNPFAQSGCAAKIMCSVYWKDGQRYRRYEKFIAESVHDRVMYLLIAEGYLGINIAKILGVSTSTVSRFRGDNRPSRLSDVPDNWRERYLDEFDWSLQGEPAGKPRKAKSVRPNAPSNKSVSDNEDFEQSDAQKAPRRKVERQA